jgi:hypothetical protein
MFYSAMTLIKNKTIITTLTLMILSKVKLNITVQSMTLSRMALNTKRSMLSVTNKTIMLSIVMLNDVMLNYIMLNVRDSVK